MRRQGMTLKCGNCSAKYDLIRATTASIDENVRCPNCGHVVGKKS